MPNNSKNLLIGIIVVLVVILAVVVAAWMRSRNDLGVILQSMADQITQDQAQIKQVCGPGMVDAAHKDGCSNALEDLRHDLRQASSRLKNATLEAMISKLAGYQDAVRQYCQVGSSDKTLQGKCDKALQDLENDLNQYLREVKYF